MKRMKDMKIPGTILFKNSCSSLASCFLVGILFPGAKAGLKRGFV
jgi:hypothetical protein